jgi:EAL domain-containing protein (putative c-di-GMP-specific phosphodiesterase class I)
MKYASRFSGVRQMMSNSTDRRESDLDRRTSSSSIDKLSSIELENDLRQAIVHNELQLHYQPQIETNSNQIKRVEALVRWEHPEIGLISPGVFIPFAEANGSIVHIDEWVLRAACEQAASWQKQGYDISVAVNLSGVHFTDKGISDKVLQILSETDLPAHKLEIELTESAVIKNMSAAIAAMKKLKRAGVQLCLDDFGTGYSSLLYLQKFPFDRLKIDRGFLNHLRERSKTATIVAAIIQLAHDLNLEVVAEGVETSEQEKFICQHECESWQGYWFSPPVAYFSLEAMLLKNQLATPFRYQAAPFVA